jgi:hypothetical protein
LGQNALVLAVPALAKTWQQQVDALAHDDWREWLEGDQELPYDVARYRLRKLLQAGLLPSVPTEATIRTCFRLSPAHARRARRELVEDSALRWKTLRDAIDKSIKDGLPKWQNRKVSLYGLPDYVEPDLLERSEFVEPKISPYRPPSRERGSPRPGWKHYSLDERLVAELKKVL